MSKVWAGLELGVLAALHSPRGILCPVLGSLLKGVLLAWPVPIEGVSPGAWSSLAAGERTWDHVNAVATPTAPLWERMEALGMG